MTELTATICAPSGPCVLRSASPADEPFLYALFAHDKAAELALTGLPRSQTDPLVVMQYRGRAVSYASAFPAARSWIVEQGARPVARLLEVQTSNEHYVIDIAVAPRHRRGGVAEGLIHWLQAQAETCGRSVSAQIFRHNAASRSLFTKLGFREIDDPANPQVHAIWRCDSVSQARGRR